MKAALVQMESSTDKGANLEYITGSISRAASRGAALCAFPEFAMFYTPGSQTPAQLAGMAETMRGGFVRAVAAAAREHRIQVVCSLYERSGRRDRVYDTSFLADARGRVASVYRKVHLYDALGFKESAKMAPGSRIARPVRTRVGRVGMMICYDLRFPELSRRLALEGSEVLVAPSAWVRGPMKEDHWVTMNRARAIENGCYVVAPDQVGNIYCGRSLAVDPYGRVLLDMKKRRGIGIVEIDPGAVRRTRKGMPLLRHRRADVYSGGA